MLKFAVTTLKMHSLEIGTFFHSAPGDVLLVSKRSSVLDSDFAQVLEKEKTAQDYRFLSALGITHVEIGGSDTEFSVKMLEPPDELTVKKGVGKLRNELTEVGVLTDEVIPSELVEDILKFKGTRRMRALDQVAKITFIAERFDAFKKRLASDKIGNYVNHYQTREEQLDTAYEILFRHSRPPSTYLDDFDFAKINFANLAPDDPYNAPRKLTISIEKTSDMLKLAINNAENDRILSSFIPPFRQLVGQLKNIYFSQFHEYSAYLAGPGSVGKHVHVQPDSARDLIGEVRAVQLLRRMALRIYESFKIPFPSEGKPLFHIYLHDPEQRGGRFPLRIPFYNIAKARIFADDGVIPSFSAVPEFYFRHRLNDVVIFDTFKGDIPHRTFNSGRAMVVFFSDILPFVEYTIRLECAHVLQYKMGYSKMQIQLGGKHRGYGDNASILQALADDNARTLLFAKARRSKKLEKIVTKLLYELRNEKLVKTWRNELYSNANKHQNSHAGKRQQKRISPLESSVREEATP